tara:strand:- start:674 stop:1135 length:462 start_codon:yes stop_codon:yes gene_type:complete
MDFNIILMALPLLILGYIIMTNIIYFLAPTKKWESFPEKCNVKTKCTRVADYNNRGYGLKVIKSKYDIEILQEKIVNIIKSEPRMKIINEKLGFIHATDITPFFRFYDDVAIKIFEEDELTKVWIQSQSRLGLHDLGVNEKRIQKLHKKISSV